MRKLTLINKKRVALAAAPTVVVTVTLPQLDDLGSLFETGTVDFKSPDGSIQGIINKGVVVVNVTQEQVINGIIALNPSTEALSLSEQVDNLKNVVESYESFADAVAEEATQLTNIIKNAKGKKIKSVSQALEVLKAEGVFIAKAEPQPEPQPEQQGAE